MPDSPTILRASNLSVQLDQRRILDACSFELARGEVLAVIGPNGAGKSTLLKAVAGLTPSTGEVSRPRGIAYIPQHVHVDPHSAMRVEEFLAARVQRRPVALGISRAVRTRIQDLLEAVEIGDKAKQSMHTLSGGERQRVMLASALAVSPDLLLLDEPASGLDPAGVQTMHRVLRARVKQEQLSAVLVSHDIGSLYHIADRVLGLNKSVEFCGAPKSVLTPQALACMFGLHQVGCEHDDGEHFTLPPRVASSAAGEHA